MSSESLEELESSSSEEEVNNKGVLERPWTKSKVLRAISSTLKFQFTVKCWKVVFL